MRLCARIFRALFFHQDMQKDFRLSVEPFHTEHVKAWSKPLGDFEPCWIDLQKGSFTPTDFRGGIRGPRPPAQVPITQQHQRPKHQQSGNSVSAFQTLPSFDHEVQGEQG